MRNNRTVQVAVRFTTQENRLLEKASKYLGVSKSDVIRMALLEKYRRLNDEGRLH